MFDGLEVRRFEVLPKMLLLFGLLLLLKIPANAPALGRIFCWLARAFPLPFAFQFKLDPTGVVTTFVPVPTAVLPPIVPRNVNFVSGWQLQM